MKARLLAPGTKLLQGTVLRFQLHAVFLFFCWGGGGGGAMDLVAY